MKKPEFNFHHEDIFRMMKEFQQGKAFVYPSTKSYMPPYDICPLIGFSYQIKYPKCCETHENIELFVNDWFYENFPNCCDFHIEMQKEDWFDKTKFEYVIPQTIDKVNYFINVFKTYIDTDKWYSEITDYYDYVIQSFGTHSIGQDPFDAILKHYIKQITFDSYLLPENRRNGILDYIQNIVSEEIRDQKELNLLIDTYRKWLESIPKIDFFEPLKDKYAKGAPVAKMRRYNRFLRAFKYTLRTKDELIDFLTKTTRKMLSEIDTTQLLNDNLIKDVTKTKLDIITEHHKIKQRADLENYDNGQMRYIKYLKRWLKNEKKYFIDIVELLPKALKSKKSYKKSDISFSELFRNSKNDIDIFLQILKRPEVNALDHESNWIYESKKSSIVACFKVLEELRTIKNMQSKSELQRVILQIIKFEASDKLFRSNYDSADYHYFDKLFRNTALNKQKR